MLAHIVPHVGEKSVQSQPHRSYSYAKNPSLPSFYNVIYLSSYLSFDEIMNEVEKCPTCLDDEGGKNAQEDSLVGPSDLNFLAPCKIQNLYLGIGGSRGDQFTTSIATQSMLDQKHGTQLICRYLEIGVFITINSKFVHFLTPTFNEDYTMNIIDYQKQELY